MEEICRFHLVDRYSVGFPVMINSNALMNGPLYGCCSGFLTASIQMRAHANTELDPGLRTPFHWRSEIGLIAGFWTAHPGFESVVLDTAGVVLETECWLGTRLGVYVWLHREARQKSVRGRPLVMTVCLGAIEAISATTFHSAVLLLPRKPWSWR